MENIAMAYTVPQTILERAKIQNLRLYLNVRNVGFYAPEMNFWDPESGGPTPRIFTLGLDLTL
jgi:hypothetical protein